MSDQYLLFVEHRLFYLLRRSLSATLSLALRFGYLFFVINFFLRFFHLVALSRRPMDSSRSGARPPTRRTESREGSKSSASEHLDSTIRFPPLDPFRVNPLVGSRDFPSLTSLARGIAAARLFALTKSSTASSFDRIGSRQSTPLVTRQAHSRPASLVASLSPPRNSHPVVPMSPDAHR